MTHLFNFFEKRYRDNGDGYVILTDDRPEWLHDAVREAHDDEFPDDWRYEMCRRICGAIDDGYLNDEDGVSEFADGAVDIYNSARLHWLADDMGRVQYVDDARDEGFFEGSADTMEQIGMGQYICIERMARVMLDAWLENGELTCDTCGRVGNEDDGCYHDDPCPDEECDGTVHRN